MKKVSLFLSLTAFTLFTLASCSDRIDEQLSENKNEHEVVFEASEVLTRTAIKEDGSNVAITWENTPAEYVHLFEDGDEGRNPKISVSNDKRTATFSADFFGMNFDIYPTYNAVIASSYNNGVATVPDVQYPTAASYDPAADILVSAAAKKLSFSSTVSLNFSRAVAISRLKFSGLKAGEKVEIIEISCANNIAGPLNKFKDYKFDGYAEGGSSKITLLYSNDNVVAQDGTFETYFVSEAVAPGSLKVSVGTDKSYYVKSAPADGMASFEFNFDKLKDISIDMTGKGKTRINQSLIYKNAEEHWCLANDKYEIGGTYPSQSFTKSSSYQKNLLSYESSDPKVASIAADGTITIHKEGEVTITATAKGSIQYKEASASYKLSIYTPYYQRITSKDQLTSGGKYLIVSRTELLVNWYHAFNAKNTGSYNFDINSSLFSSVVYDNGMKIKSTPQIDSNQVVIENGLLSSLRTLLGYNGVYTINPVSVGKYMYCDMNMSGSLTETIKLPTYDIAFSNISLSDLGLSNISNLVKKLTTIPHNITFNEDGTVVIRSATGTWSLIGADLYYDKLSNRYSYVNMSIFDGIETIEQLVSYFGKNTEYKWLFDLIDALGDNVSIKDIVSYFSADKYLYKYMD